MKLITQLTDELKGSFPGTEAQLNERLLKYIRVLTGEVATAMLHQSYKDGDLRLSLDDMKTRIGRFKSNTGKLEWAMSLFLKNPKTALFRVVRKGNTGTLSTIEIKPEFQEQLMNEITDLNYELSPKAMKDAADTSDGSFQVNIYVDRESLDSYLKKTQQMVRDVSPQKNRKYRETLQRNLVIAGYLLENIQNDQFGDYLVEVWRETDSGRNYGKGFSLQRVPKRVREAALGHCHKYDFKAASYALMAGLAQQYDPSILIGDIKHYVQHRAVIRKQIAAEVGITEDQIKEVFTSLGFGAEVSANPYKSIFKAVGYNDEAFKRLHENTMFSNVYKTMLRVREVVLASFDETEEFYGHMYNPIDPNSDPANPKKRSKDQKLAWIYQVMESYAVTQIAAMVAEKEYKPIMFAHDCIFYKSPLPQLLIDDVTYLINKEFPLLKMEHEAVWPIQEDGVYIQEDAPKREKKQSAAFYDSRSYGESQDSDVEGEGKEWWETKAGIEQMKAKELAIYLASQQRFEQPLGSKPSVSIQDSIDAAMREHGDNE